MISKIFHRRRKASTAVALTLALFPDILPKLRIDLEQQRHPVTAEQIRIVLSLYIGSGFRFLHAGFLNPSLHQRDSLSST